MALLPTLTYMGHWPTRLELPGTDAYLAIGSAAKDGHGESTGHDHSRHCHGQPAGCSDVPFTGGATVGMLSEAIVLAGSSGLLLTLALAWWRPGMGFVPSRELRPPRTLRAA